jgi:hypothetical protein
MAVYRNGRNNGVEPFNVLRVLCNLYLIGKLHLVKTTLWSYSIGFFMENIGYIVKLPESEEIDEVDT